MKAIEAPYREHLAPRSGERPLGRRFIDDAKVTDHHAIIPTATSPDKVALSADERKIYDLICRRLLGAWHDDYIWSVTTVITSIVNSDIVDRYHTSGTTVEQAGWKVLERSTEKSTTKDDGGREDQRRPETLPTELQKGQLQTVVEINAVKKSTRPPKRFTEATLLTAMETAGKTLEEKELSEAIKETGLGTPATRAAIIEVLLKRGYIVRNGKSLEATDKGIRLIEVVHIEVKSPAMTGQWEAHLMRIQRGAAPLEPFLEGIENYVRQVRAQSRETGYGCKGWRGRRGRRLRHGSKFSQNRPVWQRRSRATRCRASCRTRSVFPRFVQTRKQSVGPRLRAKMPCWLCRPGPASRCATSCLGSLVEGPRW